MKGLVSLFRSGAGAALLLSIAGSASAQSVESVTMTSDSEDIVFTLRADKPLATPVVRTYEGAVRLRFPDSSAPESIQNKGDGKAIKEVDVRSGSHGTTVMKLELGDNTKLTEADVRVENRKHIAVVRIARDLLPPMREAQPEKPAAPVAPAVVVATALVAPVEAKAVAQIKPLSPTASRPKKQLNSALQQSSAGSPVPVLIAVSALLGLAYFVLRVLMKNKAGALPKPAAIDIVAQKRIGPRHQLVIVRAFGREHLLSIQGGTTTPIATSDELIESFAPRAEPQVDLTMSQQRMLPAMNERGNEHKKEEETQFGSELLRVALAQRLKDQGVVTQTEARASTAPKQPASKDEKALSTAVAGLVRLRREAQL